MRARLLIPSALLLLVPAGGSGQTIRGIVLEDTTRTPVANALIELVARDSVHASASTDSLGYFQLRPARGGHFVVRPSHPSYAAVRTDTVTVEEREIVTLTIRMGRAAIPLQPLVVTARAQDRLAGFRERAGGTGMGRYLKRETFERQEGSKVTDILRQVAGVQIVPVYIRNSTFYTNIVTLRGTAGRCRANIYLDGMPIQQYDGSGIDDFITPDMLEGAEVYSSGTLAPAELMAPFNSCGVVAFWTREETRGGPFSWKRLGIALGVFGLLVLIAR